MGTFTDSFDWRYSLSEGDLIDCIDTEGIWYRSTVLEVRDVTTNKGALVGVGEDEENKESNERPAREANVGFRYYSEEEGHKMDDEKHAKFVGWSNRYDEWIPVTSPRI